MKLDCPNLSEVLTDVVFSDIRSCGALPAAAIESLTQEIGVVENRMACDAA